MTELLLSEFQRIFTESGQNIRDLLVKAVESFSLVLYYLLQLRGPFNGSGHTSNKRREVGKRTKLTSPNVYVVGKHLHSSSSYWTALPAPVS